MGLSDWWDKLTGREDRGSDDVTNWIFHWLFGDPGQSGNGNKNKIRNTDYDDKVKEDVAPYLPGVQQTQAIADSLRYWNDYEKNTGKTRKYPGLQTHSPDIGDVYGGYDWWVNW